MMVNVKEQTRKGKQMKQNSIIRILKYLLYLVIVVAIFLLGIKYDYYLTVESQQKFALAPRLIFSVIFPIVLGALFAIPSFYRKSRTHGRWRTDWVKLYIFGIPALLVTVSPLLGLSGPSSKMIPFANFLFTSEKTMTYTGGLVCGYLLLDIFEKNTSHQRFIDF
jgi:vacuolar-type H+-ATPase subunit I/STV1